MKEITKDEFYKIIKDNQLDVVVYPKMNEPGTLVSSHYGIQIQKRYSVW